MLIKLSILNDSDEKQVLRVFDFIPAIKLKPTLKT